MKIGFATANLEIHGVATFTLTLSQWLQARGHTVTVVTTRRGEWWGRLAKLGIAAACLAPRQWESALSHAHRLAGWITAQAFDLLVVNVGSINSRPLQLGLHLLPDSLPIVLVLHNDEPMVYDMAALNCAAWNCAVGVSPKVQQVAIRRFGQKPIQLIPYGIALPTDEQLGQRRDWATPLRLLFVGRLVDQQKGIFRLPAILAECGKQQRSVRLTVIGDGPDRARLMQLCEASGVADRVTLAGLQPNEAVLAQMRAHHLLLLPSNYEGLPIVVLEAQANGCVPVIARLPGITEAMIIEGETGKLVEPTDLCGFVDAIHTFQAAECWRVYSQAGIDHVRCHHSTLRMAEEYLVLFAALGQGAHRLAVPRSQLRRQGITPLRHWDALPQPVWRGLQRMLRRDQ